MNTLFSRLPRRAALCAVLCAAALAGCAFYEPEIVQGNFISKEQAAALQPGMTRDQVRQILGTPLVQDLFRANRWDYIFTLENRKGVAPMQYALSVFFNGDALQDVQGAADLPSEQAFVDALGGAQRYRPRPLRADAAQLEHFRQANVPAAPSVDDAPLMPATRQFAPLPQ